MKITIKSRRNLTKKGGEKRMKYSKLIIAIVATGVALGTYISSQAAEDVRSSKHNLVANTNIGATGTTEVCVFCHTPHGSRTPAGDAEKSFPLWNRNLSPTNTGYVMYTSPNLNATVAAKPMGVSMACLSCHDGTVAFDALLNKPGPGSTGTFTFTGNNVDSNTKMMINSGTNEFPMLGINLSNDHPISIEIPCTTDDQFKELCDNSTANADKATYLKRDAAYDTANAYLGDIRNRIRAYPTGGTGTRYIECASCHNPHENTSTRFLRYPSLGDGPSAKVALTDPITADTLNVDRNQGSLLCVSCHQK